MSCTTFTQTNPACRAVQLIEPDNTLLTAVSFGGVDQSLDETGSTPIPPGAASAIVYYVCHRQSHSSIIGLNIFTLTRSGIALPGSVAPVVVDANVNGFLVDFAGFPLSEGYILRWRVIVVGQVPVSAGVDNPESLRLRIPQARIFTVTFVFPRTTDTMALANCAWKTYYPCRLQRVVIGAGGSQDDAGLHGWPEPAPG